MSAAHARLAHRSEPQSKPDEAGSAAPAEAFAPVGTPRFLGVDYRTARAGAADEGGSGRGRGRVEETPLSVGSAGDAYEQQADRVARTVLSDSRAPASVIGALPPATVQRSSVQPGASPSTSCALRQAVFGPRSGQVVDPSIRRRVEPVVGRDLSAVRVHSDPCAQRAASEIQARAFTHRDHIYLGAGERHDNLALMAHELTHSAQQQGGEAGHVQRFEARYHESSERAGLGGPGGLSQDEITQIYIGNWMRDVNQAFVPTMQNVIPHHVRFALLKYMGVKKFGQSFSAEQLGFYIPAEHIDSPAGLLQPGSQTGDVVPSQPSVPEGAPIDPIPDSGLGSQATPQESVHPSAAVSADIDANIFSVDQTGVMAFMRRTNEHIERRLHLASTIGRRPEGMMHFGAALHSIEDLFAHSNWIEIAANKVLADNPMLIVDELPPGEREIFTFSGRLEAGPYREAMVAESRPILTTGSFVTLDTAVSISHELIGFLRAGLHAEEDPAVGEAQKELLLALLGQYGGENAAEYVAILQSVPFPAIPPEVLNWAFGQVNPALAGFAEQIEAEMAEQKISDTNLMAARDANRRALRGEFSSLSEQMMELEARFGAPPVAEQKRLKMAEAAEREASFAATPEQVMAGPSHSQIAKDHSNSIFFGIAFQLAAVAVARMRDKMLEVWRARGETGGVERDRPEPPHPNEAGWPWQEGYVPPWQRGRGPTPRTSRNFSSDLDDRVAESWATGESILVWGHAEDQAYDLDAMRADSAAHIKSVSDNLRLIGRLLAGQSRTRTVGVEMLRLADELKDASELIGNSETFDERHAANRRLTELQGLLAEQIQAYRDSGGSFAAMSGHSMMLGGIMVMMNREVAATAVAYTPEQRRILSDNASPLDVSHIELGEPDVSSYSDPDVQTAVRDLMMESRRILGHPYEDLWWYETVYSYVEQNAAQFAEEVRARNAGWAGFRHDGHGH